MRDPLSQVRSGPRIGSQVEERRNSERFPFAADGEVTDPASRAKLGVRISDFGMSGCYADCLNAFPVGTKVHVTIRHGERQLETPAVVAYSLSGMGMGLSFVETPVAMKATIQQWVDEARGGSAAKAAPGLDAEMHLVEQTMDAQKVVLHRLIKLMIHKGILSESERRSLFEDLAADKHLG